jgi:hypothetical protein
VRAFRLFGVCYPLSASCSSTSSRLEMSTNSVHFCDVFLFQIASFSVLSLPSILYCRLQMNEWMSMRYQWNVTDRLNRRARRKPCQVPPQILRGLAWNRIRVSAVRSQLLTASLFALEESRQLWSQGPTFYLFLKGKQAETGLAVIQG